MPDLQGNFNPARRRREIGRAVRNANLSNPGLHLGVYKNAGKRIKRDMPGGPSLTGETMRSAQTRPQLAGNVAAQRQALGPAQALPAPGQLRNALSGKPQTYTQTGSFHKLMYGNTPNQMTLKGLAALKASGAELPADFDQQKAQLLAKREKLLQKLLRQSRGRPFKKGESQGFGLPPRTENIAGR